MSGPDVNYRTLHEAPILRSISDDHDSTNETEETPRLIHTVPERSRVLWNHIEDLDSFFTRMYNYHQKHGFTVIVMDEAFQLCEFAFVVWLLTFTVHCIRHSVLFGNSPPPHYNPPKNNNTKVTINDVIIPMRECVENFGGFTFFILFLATLYFMIRLIKMIYHITQYSDIKRFYNTALMIDDSDLDNITWHEVKKRLREVQAEQHMCIDKEQLTELDIYHRILRFKNYKVALVNKKLLPVKFKAPLIGEVVCLSNGLLYNIDFILFRGPGSPFQNNWQLRDDYTVRSNQVELTQRLSNLIFWVAIANLIMAPAIFLWQMIYFSFAYANILRKEPGALGLRTWSNYGRLYLRHFNELDHELDARLNRAYGHADKYLSSFSSPVMTVLAKNLLFLSGGMLVLLLTLGIYEEFVFQIEHVLTLITTLSAIGLICRNLIPEENLIWCPEQFMTAVLAHAHYLPSEWKNQAHTATVRKDFGHLFQFKASYILNELFSPLITPFILMFVFRPKAVEIVKFFRSFTVTVKGVGNVCSFALMDVRKYGNPDWQLRESVAVTGISPHDNDKKNNQKTEEYAVENGKTELSLIRFTLTNPEWLMPATSLTFIRGIRENAVQDLVRARNSRPKAVYNTMINSLKSFGDIGEEYSSIAQSVLNMHNLASSTLFNSVQQYCIPKIKQYVKPDITGSIQETDFEQMLQQNLEDPCRSSTQLPSTSLTSRQMASSMYIMRKMRVSKTEGSLEGPSEALLYSICNMEPNFSVPQNDLTVADMCLSALYLHELHQRNTMHKDPITITDSRQNVAIVTSTAAENTPLLSSIHS